MKWPRFVRSFFEAGFGFDPNDPSDVREYDRAARRYSIDAAGRGISIADQITELKLREALARIRREASDWVRERPHECSQAITICTERARENLNKEEVRMLDLALTALGASDLLYPDARAALRRSATIEASFTRRRPTADALAALKVK